MKVTIARPFNNANTTYFHVHAAGCRDLKSRKYLPGEGWTFDAANRAAVVEDAYYDQIHSDHADLDPAELIADYESDFTFHHCTANLPTTNPTTQETTAMTTNTVAADPKFARLLNELDADVIDGIIIFTDDEGHDLEIAPINTGWFIRNEAGEALTPVLTKWECAFLLRDWDGETPTAEPTDERKVHA